jgi:ATP-dependent Zn protease
MKTETKTKLTLPYNDQYFLDLYGISDLDEKCESLPRTYRDLIENEKLDAAYHEAGHAVVGVLLGYCIPRCQIFPSNSKSILENHSWIGNCSLTPQSIDEHYAVFAAAGKVAELIREEEWYDSSDFKHCHDMEALEDLNLGLSPSDMDGISCSDNIEETFAEAHSQLREYWSVVQRVAEALMKQYVLTHGELIDLLDDFYKPQKEA